ncbi:MAG: hypothetical protein H7251_12690 [Acetobacteraceae bacterium]|nr:hypothetical protein [Acetobacteraceae bacterium]
MQNSYDSTADTLRHIDEVRNRLKVFVVEMYRIPIPSLRALAWRSRMTAPIAEFGPLDCHGFASQ